LNPSRRGVVGQLVAYVTALGVEAITGKPYKPTTQGKNERFHQTLFRWLDEQPIAATLEQLQEQVDRFDIIYNTERPHQGLPGRITPLQAWETTPKAEPPRPKGDLIRPVGSAGVRITRVARNGIVQVRSTRFHVTRLLAGQTVYLIETNEHLLVFNDRGTEIMQHRSPKPGTVAHRDSLAQRHQRGVVGQAGEPYEDEAAIVGGRGGPVGRSCPILTMFRRKNLCWR
jgi:putative transposase